MRIYNKVDLKEFIYVDRPRLDMYFEQVSDPLKKQKVPEWSASLSFAGPTAVGAQKIQLRPYTVTERIGALLEYLNKYRLAVTDPHTYVRRHWNLSGDIATVGEQDEHLPPFVNSRLSAVKVRVPRLPDRSNQLPDIQMWLSVTRPVRIKNKWAWPQHCGLVCLLEDYRGEDKLYSGSEGSAYSILESLLFALGPDLDNSVLGEHFPPQFPHSEKAMKDTIDAWWRIPNQHMSAFAKRPSVVLQKMGCAVSNPRQIESLFRVRDTGSEIGDGNRTASIFGYPVFIAAV